MNGLDLDVRESNVCSIKDLAWVSVEEVLKLEHRRETHGVASQRSDELSVTSIDGLQCFSLMLRASPDKA